MAFPDDAPVLDQLVAHADFVRRLAAALTRDDLEADELVQRTWDEASRSPPRTAENLRGWLRVVVRNTSHRLARERSRRARRERAVARTEMDASEEELLEREEILEQVTRSVLSLGRERRRAVLLRYYEGLKPQEIAERLDLPVATVKSHLTRGLSELRERLDRASGGDRSRWFASLASLAGLGASANPPAPPAPSARLRAPQGALVASVAAVVLVVGGALVWGESHAARDLAAPRSEQGLASSGARPLASSDTLAGGGPLVAAPFPGASGPAPGGAAGGGEGGAWARLEGRLVAEESGAALAGQDLVLAVDPVPDEEAGPVRVRLAGRERLLGPGGLGFRSDGEGRFTLALHPFEGRRFRLIVRGRGRAEMEARLHWTRATSRDLGAVACPPGVRLDAQVRDALGRPVPDLRFVLDGRPPARTLGAAAGQFGQLVPRHVFTGLRTDGAGRLEEAPCLLPGPYRVHLLPPREGRLEPGEIEVVPHRAVEIVHRLGAGPGAEVSIRDRTLSGFVRDAKGRALAGARIEIHCEDGRIFRRTSLTDGDFTFVHPATAAAFSRCDLVVRLAGWSLVSGPAHAARFGGPHLHLRMRRDWRERALRVRLQGSDHVPESLGATVLRAGEVHPFELPVDARGYARIPLLTGSPSLVALEPRVAGWLPARPFVLAPDAEDAERADIVFPRAERCVLRVRDAEGRPCDRVELFATWPSTPSGRPLVRVCEAGGRRPGQGARAALHRIARGATDGRGRCRLTLPAGRAFHVLVRHERGDEIFELATVTAEEVIELRLVGRSQVRGRVTTPGFVARCRELVRSGREIGGPLLLVEKEGRHRFETSVDTRGRFLFADVPVGRYELRGRAFAAREGAVRHGRVERLLREEVHVQADVETVVAVDASPLLFEIVPLRIRVGDETLREAPVLVRIGGERLHLSTDAEGVVRVGVLPGEVLRLGLPPRPAPSGRLAPVSWKLLEDLDASGRDVTLSR